jgi:hypothetical protein
MRYYWCSTTFSAPVFDAFAKTSYAFIASFSANRCVAKTAGTSRPAWMSLRSCGTVEVSTNRVVMPVSAAYR